VRTARHAGAVDAVVPQGTAGAITSKSGFCTRVVIEPGSEWGARYSVNSHTWIFHGSRRAHKSILPVPSARDPHQRVLLRTSRTRHGDAGRKGEGSYALGRHGLSGNLEDRRGPGGRLGGGSGAAGLMVLESATSGLDPMDVLECSERVSPLRPPREERAASSRPEPGVRDETRSSSRASWGHRRHVEPQFSADGRNITAGLVMFRGRWNRLRARQLGSGLHCRDAV